MISQPPTSPAETQPETRAQATEHCRLVLLEMLDLNAEMVRRVVASTPVQADADGKAADTSPAFDRVMRSLRRTVMLIERLGEPASTRAERTPAQEHAAKRRQIIRGVEDTIQRETEFVEDIEERQAEFYERMDTPELADDIDHCPAAEIIEEICRDLEMGRMPDTHPWARRKPADIAAMWARARGEPVTHTVVLAEGGEPVEVDARGRRIVPPEEAEEEFTWVRPPFPWDSSA